MRKTKFTILRLNRRHMAYISSTIEVKSALSSLSSSPTLCRFNIRTSRAGVSDGGRRVSGGERLVDSHAHSPSIDHGRTASIPFVRKYVLELSENPNQ
jgi:hypothetical protein